ncbi:MAG: T9SS C-terminal target domain-containing protein, partial [Ignavibacteriales bacterium]
IFLNAGGTVYFSSNTGNTWEKRNIGYGIISLAFSKNGNILAGTINSGLLISSDKGISWSNLVIPDVNRIDMIETDDMNRITVSCNGKLYHSPDGASWTEIFASDTAFFVPGFLTVNDNGTIFFGGFTFFLEEKIFYSQDFGTSWNSTGFGTFEDLMSLYSDGTIIYTSFDDGSIKFSDDDGVSWQNFAHLPSGYASGITKLTNGVLLASTGAGEIFYTSDNGKIWQSLSAGLPSTFFNFITADVNEMLYIGHYSEGVYKNDNWFNVVPVELSSFTVSVIDNDVNLNWITSTETNNSGFEIERMSSSSANWQKIGFAAGSGTTTGNKVYSFKDNNLYPGRYSYRLKQIDYDGSFSYSDDVEIEISIPDKFTLNQNYPNPFNPVTNISFQIAEPVLVSLKIFDIVGNEITVLINEQKEPGFYNLKFDASELSSGTYFYQLKAGNNILTKKLLLLK